ncbi:MAG TPA: DUF4215 domain-containing protein [Kofleriaceae bacterium]|jgi:cysteine-rich repeat protein|nr:DUF4215 domain-containing protein [Kofleriaceae bacterium]
MRWAVAPWLVALGGCLAPDLVPCGDLSCASGDVCFESRKCVSSENLDACGGVADGAACATRAVVAGVCHDAVCITPGCGNGVVDGAEMCDDGNVALGDGCSADCLSDETCGNGVLDFFEACDDGNHLSADGCSSACRVERLRALTLDRPGPRDLGYPVMAYDEARQQLVMFGVGKGGAATWIFDGTGWHQGPPGPSARMGAAMAYDPARQRIVLFGGKLPTGVQTEYADTWELDGASWTQVQITGNRPPARHDHQMAYDATRQRIVLVGGATGPLAFESFRSDTWTFDGTTWASIPAALPAGRKDAGLAFDEARQQLVLVGGTGSSAATKTEMWALDASTWTLLATSVPATNKGELVYDRVRARLVLLGDGNTWEEQATTWTARTDSPIMLSEGYAEAFAYDPVRGRSVLYGAGQHWELGDAWTRDPFCIARLEPVRAVFDSARTRLVVHGGRRSVETWTRDAAGAWTLLTTPSTPMPSGDAALVYDPVRRATLGFGTRDGAGETWLLEDDAWRQLTTATTPPARIGHRLVYDVEHQRVVMSGGADPTTERPHGDTWTFDGVDWQRIESKLTPAARSIAGVVYDAARGRVVLAGGEGGFNTLLSDHWELVDSEWGEATPMPAPREGGKFVYDPVRRRPVWLAGFELTGGETVVALAASVWQYEVASPAPPRWYFGYDPYFDITYDTAAREIVGVGAVGTNDGWALGVLQWRADDDLLESCSGIDDADEDGLRGCADPDCFALCDPACLPGATCPENRPRCGDGACDAALENHARCAEDCP